MKVNTFIVGAPKSGTTSLHFYLQQHPDVCMRNKRPNYFTAKEVVKLYYDVSPVNSEIGIIPFLQNQLGELLARSVSYLFYPEVAQKIYINPEAILIF